MNEHNYDIIVVGSGTAAQTFIGDIVAYAGDLRIAVITESPAGGVCALEGCNAKKFFCEISSTVLKTKHLLGKGFKKLSVPDWEEALKQKTAFTDPVSERTIEWLISKNVSCYNGGARFVDETTMKVGEDVLSAEYIVLATGARPRKLDIKGEEYVFTSKDFLEHKNFGRSYVFIGGGFVSAEFATIVTGFGGETTIINHSDHLLNTFDNDVVDEWRRSAEVDGIKFQLNIGVKYITKEPNGKLKIFLSDGTSIFSDYVVNGTGRIPNVEELNVDRANIVLDKRGIVVNKYMQTSNERVFAIGDCINTMQLARLADCEAHVAAINCLKKIRERKSPLVSFNYLAPAIVFTYPQIAMVGKTEQSLINKGLRLGIDYEVSSGKDVRWANDLREGSRFSSFKIIMSPDSRKILGAHIFSPEPSGCINSIKTAMLAGRTVEELWRETVLSPYPTRESDLTYMLNPFLQEEKLKY